MARRRQAIPALQPAAKEKQSTGSANLGVRLISPRMKNTNRSLARIGGRFMRQIVNRQEF